MNASAMSEADKEEQIAPDQCASAIDSHDIHPLVDEGLKTLARWIAEAIRDRRDQYEDTDV